MTLINGWAKTTTTLATTAQSFVLATGGNNYILTTGTLGDAPYYSRDGGVTWVASTVSDTDWYTSANTCLATMASDGHIYLISQAISKLYVSADNGVTYTVASSGTAYACLACSGTTLFASQSTGTNLYKSTDHGSSFALVTLPATTASNVWVSSSSPYIFICCVDASANAFFIYRSSDNGATWTQVLATYSLGYVGAIWHTASSTYLGVYDTAKGCIVLKSDDFFSTITDITIESLPAPVTLGGTDSSEDIYFASNYVAGVVCTSPDGGTTVNNETPDSNTPAMLAVGSTSIVAITSAADNSVSVYSGVLPGGVVPPSISPTTVLNASPLTVTITTSTSGASIYYTTDGSTPTTSSTLYTSPFILTYATATTCTVKAITVKDSTISSVATQLYRVGNQVSAPVITGTVNNNAYATVSITDDTDGAIIYYTLDGTTPTAESIRYTETFLSFDTYINAIAVKTGYFDSDVTSTTLSGVILASDYPTLGPYFYAYNCNPVETSVRKFTTGVTTYVDMLSTTGIGDTNYNNATIDHAAIYYTLDNTTPTAESIRYTNPIEITTSCVIKAVAIKNSHTPIVGPVTTITYIFEDDTYAKPTAYNLSGEYIDLETGAVTTVILSDPNSPYIAETTAAAFIPEYNNGIGALAIFEYGLDQQDYIYLCDPNTLNFTKRLPASTGNSRGTVTIAYSADKKLLYTGGINDSGAYIYSIDIITGSITLIESSFDADTSYFIGAYSSKDHCLYINEGVGHEGYSKLVKYNTDTNTTSTISEGTNQWYPVYVADPYTGTLYGNVLSYSYTNGFTYDIYARDPSTGVVTQILSDTDTSADAFSIAQDVESRNIYAFKYTNTDVNTPKEKHAITAYLIDLATGTETQKFNSTTTRFNGGNVVVVSNSITPAPLLSVAAGTYTSVQSVAITCANTSASIYYTTDGSTPTAASNLYTVPVTVSTSSTLKAIAIINGIASTLTVAVYVINASVQSPIISPAPNTYIGTIAVSITSATPSAAIYYSTNGTNPTSTTGMLYTGSFDISKSTTVKAIATITGLADSALVSASYTITELPTASAPTITPASGQYTTSTVVTIQTALASGIIHYTTDGTTPTNASPVYTVPFAVTEDTTVQAIVIANNYKNSAVSSASYIIATPQHSYLNIYDFKMGLRKVTSFATDTDI